MDPSCGSGVADPCFLANTTLALCEAIIVLPSPEAINGSIDWVYRIRSSGK